MDVDRWRIIVMGYHAVVLQSFDEQCWMLNGKACGSYCGLTKMLFHVVVLAIVVCNTVIGVNCSIPRLFKLS